MLPARLFFMTFTAAVVHKHLPDPRYYVQEELFESHAILRVMHWESATKKQGHGQRGGGAWILLLTVA